MGDTVISSLLSFETDGFFWFFFALTLLSLWFLALVVRRVWARRKEDAETGTEDANLMKVSYLHDRDPEALRLAYLRSLTSDRATLVVSDRGLRIGSQLTIHLDSLHAHPQLRAEPVLGKVVQTKKLNSSPDNFLVNVEFLDNAFVMNSLGIMTGTREKTS